MTVDCLDRRRWCRALGTSGRSAGDGRVDGDRKDRLLKSYLIQLDGDVVGIEGGGDGISLPIESKAVERSIRNIQGWPGAAKSTWSPTCFMLKFGDEIANLKDEGFFFSRTMVSLTELCPWS